MSKKDKNIEKPNKQLAKQPAKSQKNLSQNKNQKKKGGFSIVSFLLWAIILFLIAGGVSFYYTQPKASKITTSDGIELIKGDTVKSVETTEFDQVVHLELKENFHKDYPDEYTVDNDKVFFFYVKDQGGDIWNAIKTAAGYDKFEDGFNSNVPQSSMLESIVTMLLPLLIIFAIFYFAMSKMGGENNPLGFGKMKNGVTNMNGETPDTTFGDVAGIDEAVEEMQEIRDFMAEPAKYHAIGAKIPKGVLLYGPPGTGKTLLARAVAGEAKVPFFSLSGSDFVEMFVGVGASRVRDLFKKAKQASPAIIFIDEIDAVGRHRGSGMGGGHDEREQTLNQMLVEMDGFDETTNVLLIAATNRPDILDPALLRPGRFDRQISVDAPDLKGRKSILEIYSKNKPFEDDVDLDMIAKRTPGYTGADLANVVNEAALLAVRLGKEKVSNDEFDESIDRVMAGPQRKSRKMNENDIKNTAYHEAGHAIVAAAMYYTDPVTKVTILPRGKALGYTSVMPSEDRYSVTRNQLLDQMAYAMGGRVAEEVIFKDPSTGASNDIEKATDIAKKLVTLYGMSSKVGPIKVAPDENDTAIGATKTTKFNVSGSVADEINSEVHDLLENAHREALTVIEENREVLEVMVAHLLDKETLLEDEITEIFRPLKYWGERPIWDSFSGRREHVTHSLKSSNPVQSAPVAGFGAPQYGTLGSASVNSTSVVIPAQSATTTPVAPVAPVVQAAAPEPVLRIIEPETVPDAIPAQQSTPASPVPVNQPATVDAQAVPAQVSEVSQDVASDENSADKIDPAADIAAAIISHAKTEAVSTTKAEFEIKQEVRNDTLDAIANDVNSIEVNTSPQPDDSQTEDQSDGRISKLWDFHSKDKKKDKKDK
jgi:cell division protease FtsH